MPPGGSRSQVGSGRRVAGGRRPHVRAAFAESYGRERRGMGPYVAPAATFAAPPAARRLPRAATLCAA
jgi:hypothetical protein